MPFSTLYFLVDRNELLKRWELNINIFGQTSIYNDMDLPSNPLDALWSSRIVISKGIRRLFIL